MRICISIKTKIQQLVTCDSDFVLFILTAEEWPPPNVAITVSLFLAGCHLVYITSNSVTSKGQSQQNSDRDVDSERWLSVCQRFRFNPLV